MSLGTILTFGLLLGMQHATEPDHLAAIAALASRERSIRAGLLHGMAWGIGHTLVLLLVAGALGFLGWVISPLMAGNLERLVGAMLILLGIGVIRRMRRERAHRKTHSHAWHVSDLVPPRFPRLPWRGVIVGMVHGLAGSAALALLASQAMPSPTWMLVYIGVFGLGSILGMALLSSVLAIPLGLTARHFSGTHSILNGGVALFSFGLGSRLLFAVGR